MKKPITLYIPNYYNTKTSENDRLKLEKTAALLEGDLNNAVYHACIKTLPNYQCTLPEISEDDQKRATEIFQTHREKDWELPVKVSNCNVYSTSWEKTNYHFRIYWIVISDAYLLELAGIFEPLYSAFYKRHFMTYFQATEIQIDFDFSTTNHPDQLFESEEVAIPLKDLQELIDATKEKEKKAQFLEENLKIQHPNFYSVLEAELKEKEEALVEAFMCTDWNMYYDLYNPENFSDPDSTIAWESNKDVFEYYEKPYTNNTKVTIALNRSDFNRSLLKNLIDHKQQAEQNLLAFFEHYTFGNGGAYADAIHYKYAKIEIERLHNTSYTNSAFLKRNLCLSTLQFSKNNKELQLYFNCSWDTEHGVYVIINDKLACRTE